MQHYYLQCLGETALQIVFGQQIDRQINARVHAAYQRLQSAALVGVANLVPAYASLTVVLQPLAVLLGQTSVAKLSQQLPDLLAQITTQDFQPRRVSLPVCYNGEDLDRVAQHTGLTVADIIRRHSAAVYEVYFLGFSAGFAYLGGLDPALATPRLASPRLQVPAGSVAIGGSQTAVYPQATPGGWNLIGHCPEPLFDLHNAEAPCRLAAGDEVVFVPVTSI